MSMNQTKTQFEGVYLIQPTLHQDERGIFYRRFDKEELAPLIRQSEIIQINHSINNLKGTLRGMHFQIQPASEMKLVHCVRGSVFDVVVDLRKGSATYLQWLSFELSETNRTMLIIPEGMAHGFMTLQDKSELFYYHTQSYQPKYERGLLYSDPKIGIKWPSLPSVISDRDKSYPLLSSLDEKYEL